ncbi:MAG: dolichyl-phosphate-mannose-protein mannosyltransferase [Parcubacteria group bacterium Gr01-1014_38]|nr:MAG: dolichyl-phosphate-mannose-protein mannosyltransferase [Parcubacteria group bacterium Gr01-1014_38]
MAFRPLVMVGLITATLALLVRLQGLGAILTADEPQWMFRAQSFTTALRRGDPGGTFQGTHPGVTAMLLIGAGIEAREWLTGERMESPTVGSFRSAGKLPIAIAVSLGTGMAAALVARLWGVRSGLGAGVLLTLNPFFVGYSQLAHVDALLAILMLLSVLTALWYVRQGARRILVLSGFLGGLALLTKLPAVFLVPFAAGVFLLVPDMRARWIRDTATWVGVTTATFLILWPSMWLNVLPNVRYAARDVQSVVTLSHFGESAEVRTRDNLFYARALLARTTPVTLLFAALGALACLRAAHRRREALVFLLFFGGFFLFVNLVEKRADRYLLPALLVLDVFAGVSLGELIRRDRFGKLLAAGTICVLAVLNLQLSPYALAYVSPFSPKEEPTQAGWGEGLERAAAVLNAHPLAPELQVATWYPIIFREFFRGTTMSLSSRDDARVDYVVTYRNMRGRPADSGPTRVLEEFANVEPVAVIRVVGLEMAWIYARDSVDRFPKHVGEIVRAGAPERGTGNAPTTVEVGQTVVAESDGLSGVRLVFATFSSRSNRGELLLHVRENPDGADLRTVRIGVSRLEDNAWKEIRFEPLPNSKGVTYYVALTSPSGEPGNAVTVRYQPNDILPGRLVVLRRPLRSGEKRAASLAEGDLAYALVYQGDASHSE